MKQAPECLLNNDDGYEDFLTSIRNRFQETAKEKELFTTDAKDLFDLFLSQLPVGKKQYYTCRSCRHFMERFGSLVSIDADGNSTPVMWDAEKTPELFRPAVAALENLVRKAEVTGVFLTPVKVWGTPVTGDWHHMSVVPDKKFVYSGLLLEAGQMAANKLEERGMLLRGLSEFSVDSVRIAKSLLETDSLYRSEKVLGVAEWLLSIHEKLGGTKNERTKHNLVWRFVAQAPAGWCHVRTTMISTLLEDLANKVPHEVAAKKFAEKMHPLQYRRTTAAPSEGQIDQAEKIIEKLRSAGALERRFAKLEDLQLLWKPVKSAEPKEEGGVFGHLRGKKQEVQDSSLPVTMTWVKFEKEVLPKAEQIEFLVPHEKNSYVALVTAADADSPPILQWDREDRRNQVSLYMYVYGSRPEEWNLEPGEYRKVTGISLDPSMWDPEHPHPNHKDGVSFILDGCADKLYTAYMTGGGLFVESLRSEYFPIRKTLEAHIAKKAISGKENSTACGVHMSNGKSVRTNTFRVTSGGIRRVYAIDRWD